MRAVGRVSFDRDRGEMWGWFGETEAGKTTVGRTMLRLYEASGGKVIFDGVDLISLKRRELDQIRRRISMIFQDPLASLNPRMTIGSIVGEPLLVHKVGNKKHRRARVRQLLDHDASIHHFPNVHPPAVSLPPLGGASARNGMSASERNRQVPPWFPCRPGILSPIEICRLVETYTLTISSTPDGSKSPRFIPAALRSRSSMSSSIRGQNLSTITKQSFRAAAGLIHLSLRARTCS